MALSIERRMWVRLISNDALKSYMQSRGFRSVNELAMRIGVSKATIGHLHSGARRTCSPGQNHDSWHMLNSNPSHFPSLPTSLPFPLPFPSQPYPKP